MQCVASKRHQWQARLKEELKDSSSALFITLTYSDENLVYGTNGLATLDKYGVQCWIKRLRVLEENKLRYFLVGEYGSRTFRPHYHLLLFNMSGSKTEVYEKLCKSWALGLVHMGAVTDASIAYCTKYMIQAQEDMFEGIQRPFNLMSRKPGIGSRYLDKKANYHESIERNFIRQNGKKNVLPRFYRDRLYDADQRSKQNAVSKVCKVRKEAEECATYSTELDYIRVKFSRKQGIQERIKKTLKNSRL